MSEIEWCDVTWNPVVGCSRVSKGCDNCYAIGVATRNLCAQHKGLTKIRPRDASRPGADWTGEVRVLPQKLDEPLRWRKPRRVFVNSMSDLFHAQVPESFRAAVFAAMAACPQHTFIIATKRPGRDAIPWTSAAEVNEASMGYRRRCQHHAKLAKNPWRSVPWPLPNVHVLVSAEDQAAWSKRVPALLEMPAAVKGVSAEPLLAPIAWPDGIEQLDWLVIGGESGPSARPCAAPWIRELATKGRDAGVAIFIKQLGSSSVGAGTQAGKGNDMSTWPDDLRVREFPRGTRA